MNLLYRGISLDDCLGKASLELNIPKEKLHYNIIKKSGFFSKEFMVEVIFEYPTGNTKVENKSSIDIYDTEVEIKNTPNIEDNYELNELNELNEFNEKYGVIVEDGEILVYEDIFNQNQFKITPCYGITLFINNEKCKNTPHTIYKNDIITYKSLEIESSRKFNITVSEDKMAVYLNIEYIPKATYKLKDSSLKQNLILEAEQEIIEYPEKYTLTDIIKDLNKINIKSGVIIKNIKECCLNGGENILIAKGTPAINDVPTKIEIFFECDNNKTLYTVDEFRNLHSNSYVKTQDILAKIIPGSIGENGVDIYGEIVKKLTIKAIPVNVKNGCRIKNDTIIATTYGRPNVQSGILSVNPVYKVIEIDSDTGDIFFKGDIEVDKNISTNNKVMSSNSILVKGNVLSSKLYSTGDIKIFRNSINSTLIAGGKDLDSLKESYIITLKNYINELDSMLVAIEKLKVHYPNKSINDFTKSLIETRYKNLPKLSTNIITYNLKQGIITSEILDFIKNKIIGLTNFKVDSIKEIYRFKSLLEKEFKILNVNIIIPSNIYVSYSESSLIKASNDIIISGKGEYNSEIRSLSSIKFIDENSVAIKGDLYANKSLELKTVGNPSGIKTKLQVDEAGVITADKAYSNTLFTIGYKQYLLERPMKNIKVQLNSRGEIDIEGLSLY